MCFVVSFKDIFSHSLFLKIQQTLAPLGLLIIVPKETRIVMDYVSVWDLNKNKLFP